MDDHYHPRQQHTGLAVASVGFHPDPSKLAADRCRLADHSAVALLMIRVTYWQQRSNGTYGLYRVRFYPRARPWQ